jgi:hypothetical protein
MNKIKVMLSAIAVLAVVGGALAFKAKGEIVYCDSVPHFTPDCPLLTDHTFNPNGYTTSYCTTEANQSCIETSTITTLN